MVANLDFATCLRTNPDLELVNAKKQQRFSLYIIVHTSRASKTALHIL